MRNAVWLRSCFAILTHCSSPLVYFDNASTARKLVAVLDVFKFAHFKVCANLARGGCFLSSKLALIQALARRRVLSCLRANVECECIAYKSAARSAKIACAWA